jgi:hypothetical protein
LKKQIIEHEHELKKLQELITTTSKVLASLAFRVCLSDALILIRSKVNCI